MSQEMLQAIEGLNKTFHEFKAANDQRLAEIEKDGKASAELEQKLAKLGAEMQELEKKAARPPAAPAGETKAGNEPEEVKRAFDGWLRKGGVTPEERKLLSTGDDTEGGYLAPRQMVSKLIASVTEVSPIRSVALVIPTSKKGIEIPKKTGAVTATWAGDGQSVAASNGSTGLETIDANMLIAVTEVSVEMLEDSEFDLGAFLQADMAEQFAAAEGLAFVTGNGVKKPQGILTYGGSDIVQKANGHASALQADAVTRLAFGIKTAYAQNGTFALNRNTLFEIYTLKDGQGQYLYRPNQDVGRPPTIQGKPYIEAPDMPDVATDAYPILFGDFRRGYTIADRVQLAILRDTTTKAEQGLVRFIGRKRVGGQVVLGEAFAKLKIATSV